jgi:archaellum component FlaC
MSKGDLVLSLAGLDALAGQLRSIKKRMEDAGQVDRKLGHGELGSSSAFDAMEDFMDGWKDGRKEIDVGVDGVAKMAQEIVDKMTKLDVDLRKALSEHEKEGKDGK